MWWFCSASCHSPNGIWLKHCCVLLLALKRSSHYSYARGHLHVNAHAYPYVCTRCETRNRAIVVSWASWLGGSFVVAGAASPAAGCWEGTSRTDGGTAFPASSPGMYTTAPEERRRFSRPCPASRCRQVHVVVARSEPGVEALRVSIFSGNIT